jgi:RNA polymerase sigma-70 factor (ECF subfamily)
MASSASAAVLARFSQRVPVYGDAPAESSARRGVNSIYLEVGMVMGAVRKTDLDLIEEFRRGRDESFEELIGRYSTKVHSLAARLTRNAEDAEEVLQDVFVTVYRKIAGFEGKSSFSSWLYRVTVNAAFMKLRKKRQDPAIPLEDILEQAQMVPALKSPENTFVDAQTIRLEMLEALEAAIRRLPDEYRPVFILRDVDGLTSKEVGRILELSVPAVKSRLHRSRLMLRRRLHRFFGEGRVQNAADVDFPISVSE